MKQNDDEQTTVNDLLSMMQEHFKDSSSDAFTSKWLKNRLMEYFKNSLRLLIEKMFLVKSSDMSIASIGQAIMQAVRPKAIIAPLQTELGV